MCHRDEDGWISEIELAKGLVEIWVYLYAFCLRQSTYSPKLLGRSTIFLGASRDKASGGLCRMDPRLATKSPTVRSTLSSAPRKRAASRYRRTRKREGHNSQSKPYSLYQYAGQQARGAEPPSISPRGGSQGSDCAQDDDQIRAIGHHYAQTSMYVPQSTYLLVVAAALISSNKAELLRDADLWGMAAAALQPERVANYHSRKVDYSR